MVWVPYSSVTLASNYLIVNWDLGFGANWRLNPRVTYGLYSGVPVRDLCDWFSKTRAVCSWSITNEISHPIPLDTIQKGSALIVSSSAMPKKSVFSATEGISTRLAEGFHAFRRHSIQFRELWLNYRSFDRELSFLEQSPIALIKHQ